MNEKTELKEDKVNSTTSEIQEKTPEENEAWFKANLDYIGRSYSVYLYFMLIVAITTCPLPEDA